MQMAAAGALADEGLAKRPGRVALPSHGQPARQSLAVVRFPPLARTPVDEAGPDELQQDVAEAKRARLEHVQLPFSPTTLDQ